MYFNRKNAEQKNWRMIKKGKHFLPHLSSQVQQVH